MTEAFSADWLALREPFDATARAVGLARRLVSLLPARPRLVDLGAGTGGMFRWLAPLIGRTQVWTLVDADEVLLQRAFGDIERWAAGLGLVTTEERRALLVHAPGGAWRVEALALDLAEALPPVGTDAVVCSALLDLVSAAWLERLADWLTGPLLATLSVDGRDVWRPAHPAGTLVRAGFRRDQGRDKGFGPALGPRAPAALAVALAARGFGVESAPSDWRVPPSALLMQRALVEGHREAAARAMPARRAVIDAWRSARMRQVAQGRLAIRVGHRDSLAVPPR
jgi:hypothetical protein